MKTILPMRSFCFRVLPAILAGISLQAATIWTGPNITYTKSGSTPADTIIAGKVVLKRNSSGVLVNTAAGESFPGLSSPADTMWAFGTLANAQTLTYQSMDSLRNGNLSARILNQNMVVHLINEDIYFSIKFTAWGQHGSGTVSYSRSTAATANPPTVSISSPAAGSVFAAPATVALSANASATGGTVTNVEYFVGTTSLGKSGISPFTVNANLSTPNTYSIVAVATASGLSTTSAPVSISVVAPVDVSLSAATIASGNVSFNYTVNPGLKYVIQQSSDLSSLANWTSIVTNTPNASPATYAEPFSAGNARRFFRVGRLPNP